MDIFAEKNATDPRKSRDQKLFRRPNEIVISCLILKLFVLRLDGKVVASTQPVYISEPP
jgi:hypothetical protein